MTDAAGDDRWGRRSLLVGGVLFALTLGIALGFSIREWATRIESPHWLSSLLPAYWVLAGVLWVYGLYRLPVFPRRVVSAGIVAVGVPLGFLLNVAALDVPAFVGAWIVLGLWTVIAADWSRTNRVAVGRWLFGAGSGVCVGSLLAIAVHHVAVEAWADATMAVCALVAVGLFLLGRLRVPASTMRARLLWALFMLGGVLAATGTPASSDSSAATTAVSVVLAAGCVVVAVGAALGADWHMPLGRRGGEVGSTRPALPGDYEAS
jgi:hypothetical protein